MSIVNSSDSCSSASSRKSSPNSVVLRSFDFNDIISWNPAEGKLSIYNDVFNQYSNEGRIFLLKSRCLSRICGCTLKNHGIYFAKAFMKVKLLVGKWNKIKFSKTAIPDTETLGKYILFRQYNDWMEIMNENFEVIPFWSSTSQFIHSKSRPFLMRKDTKCLIMKEAVDESSFSFDPFILKSGSVLTFVNVKPYPVRKGRKIKDQTLIKCKDSTDNLFYFLPDEACYSSPISGPENISGAHTIETIIDKFHFPLNVKSIFSNPPLPNLPSTERHYLQLSRRYQLDLIFVTPYNDPKRFFIITPGLFDDHYFSTGELFGQSVLKQPIPQNIQGEIDSFKSRLTNFFQKSHKFECLDYLLKYAIDISKISPLFEQFLEPEFDEVDDIYFFIRNGFFPRKSGLKLKQIQSKRSDSRKETVENKPEKDDEFDKEKENNNLQDFIIKAAIKDASATDESSISESSSSSSNEDGANNSSVISTTSSESDATSSTALEFSKNQLFKQAKSMPLSKKPYRSETTISSRNHFAIDFSLDDIANLPNPVDITTSANRNQGSFNDSNYNLNKDGNDNNDEEESNHEGSNDSDDDNNDNSGATDTHKISVHSNENIKYFYHKKDHTNLKNEKVLNLEKISLKHTAV